MALNEKIQELFGLVSAGVAELRSIATNLGFSLATTTEPQELATAYHDCLAGQFGTAARNEPGFDIGYRAALRDLTGAYLLGMREKEATDPKLLLAWLLDNPAALVVLRMVRVAEVGSTENLPSRVVQQLYDKRLLSPLPGGKFCSLTLLAHKVLETEHAK